MDRRTFLTLTGSTLASFWTARLLPSVSASPAAKEDLLDDLQRRCFRYFYEQTDPGTGLTLDRAAADGTPYTLGRRPASNLTVTGFGLAAFCIAADRGWIGRAEAANQVRSALRFFAHKAPHQMGWFYHWLHVRNGQRAGAFSVTTDLSEVSSIDTAFLLAGVLTVRQYFKDDKEMADLADFIYRRVNFPWMLKKDSLILGHGWTPEKRFIDYDWSEYSEANLLYLLAIASPTHPIPAQSWYAWKRNPNLYGRYRYVGTTPLFTYQYSHAFFDFRRRRDKKGTGDDWFGNSVTATHAHRQFCIDLAKKFPGFSDVIWGITCSFSDEGYVAWGGPPFDPRIDGTVVPSAAAGSLMFAPEICLPALRAVKDLFGAKIYGRYGFTDAFQPSGKWISQDVLGLNLGITLLSAENLRSGKPWSWFMANPEAARALALADFRPD